LFVSLGMKEIKNSTPIQTSLFQPLTGLVGQQAFLVAKKVAMGQLTYEEAVAMVASEGELLDDISYINGL
jgi:hypothetical protein